jgi:hypothetical protein
MNPDFKLTGFQLIIISMEVTVPGRCSRQTESPHWTLGEEGREDWRWLFSTPVCHRVRWEGLVVIMGQEWERGLGWCTSRGFWSSWASKGEGSRMGLFFVPNFATGHARRSWQSSKDMNREEDTAQYLTVLVSESLGVSGRYSIWQVWYLIGSVSDMFSIWQVWYLDEFGVW